MDSKFFAYKHLKMDLEKLNNWLESEEGKKSMEEFAERYAKQQQIVSDQLNRFHQKYRDRFSEIVDKVVAKYNGDEYRQRWYKRGIEPPEMLCWYLFFYAEKYGRQCNEDEWKTYANMFTTELYYAEGFYFGRMDGQGSVIQIYKEDVHKSFHQSDK